MDVLSEAGGDVSAQWHVPLGSARCFVLQARFILCALVQPETLPHQVGNTNTSLSSPARKVLGSGVLHGWGCLISFVFALQPALVGALRCEAGEWNECPVPCTAYQSNWLQLKLLPENWVSRLEGKMAKCSCLGVLGIPATICVSQDNSGH